jgi:MoxR-like ATPase
VLGALSQAIAWTDGRDHAIPEDVQAAARPVLRHRVVATEASAAASARIVEDALRSVAVPP